MPHPFRGVHYFVGGSVIGRAAPYAELSKRLLRILERQPHLYVPISHYLMRAERLSRENSRQCLQLAKAYDLYPAFTASLLTVLRGRVHPSYQLELIRHCKSLLIADPDRYEDPELEVAAISVLLENGTLSWSQTRFNVLRRKDWWVRSEIIRYVQKDIIGNPSYEFLLNGLLRDKSIDVSLVGADLMIAEGCSVTEPRNDINKIAQLALKAAGMISRVSASVCPVSEAMVVILDPSLAIINWQKLLGPSYLDTIPKIIRWRGYAMTDSTAWVNITDTINDVILNALYSMDGAIGTYILGSIGSVLTPGPGNRFMAKYPKLFKSVVEINAKRKESDLSHPITRLTGRPTRYIRFSELPALKKALREGYLEMWNLLGL